MTGLSANSSLAGCFGLGYAETERDESALAARRLAQSKLIFVDPRCLGEGTIVTRKSVFWTILFIDLKICLLLRVAMLGLKLSLRLIEQQVEGA